MDHKIIISKILEPINKTTVDKAPQRIVMARLEIYGELLRRFGAEDCRWETVLT